LEEGGGYGFGEAQDLVAIVGGYEGVTAMLVFYISKQLVI
jgi:hypothetical protein